MATQSSLQYHNENSAKNRLNLLHIIILATSVGQTSRSHIDWKCLIVQHPQQCGEHPHQEMASYGPAGGNVCYFRDLRDVFRESNWQR